MKRLLLILVSTLILNFNVGAQTLVSAVPNLAQVGTTLTTTITGAGTFFQNSSPQGNVNDIYIEQGGANYYADFFSIMVTDDAHVDASIFIPSNAATGSYNLHVGYIDPNNFTFYDLTINNGIIVGPPDGYIQGRVFDDTNGNGVQDVGENGIAGQIVSISSLPNVITDANGDFSVGVLNGNYTVAFVTNANNYIYVPAPFPSSYPVTINNANSTGNDFATTHALVSVYPDSAYIGQTFSLTITSNNLFALGNVSNTGVSINRTMSPTGFNSSQVTFVNSNTIIAKFNVPNNVAYLGLYNVRVYCNSGLIGNHYLNNSFSVVDAPVYMNGIVYFDVDSNGVLGPGESGVGGGKLLLTPDSTYAFSDITGNYSFGTTAGTHTITMVNQLGLQLSAGSPSSYTATVNSTTSGYDFGLSNNHGLYADSVRLGACWSGCAHPNYFYITYENIGLIPYSGYVYMVLDPNNMFYTPGPFNMPDSIIGDTLFWNFTNLQPLQPVTLKPYINTPVGGDTIYYSVTMVALDAIGNMVSISTDSNSHVVNCSFDPNEKYVQPEGVLAQHYTLKTDELLYTIVFQNTGTDTAYTVIVRDTIDDNLDLNTLEVFASSAVVNTELSLLTRVVKFTFNNILLVDSNHNEADSHGFIRYRIRAKQGVADNTVIYNNAGIYFDFNAPVITNTTFNTLVTTLPVGLQENTLLPQASARVVPNPFSQTASLWFENSLKQLFDLSIYSVTGKKLINLTTRNNRIELQRQSLSPGIYFYDLKNSVNGKRMKGKFVIQ